MVDAIYEGHRHRVVWAREKSGRMRGKEFFDALEQQEQAKFEALFQRLAETGRIFDPRKFRAEGAGIFCFKIRQRRLACFFDGKDIAITHGFVKKGDKVPPGETDRAKRIRNEHLSR